MSKLDLSKYGITGTTEIVHNPSYELLFEEETKAGLEGFEKGQVTELGAVNVMTGIYTGRSPMNTRMITIRLPKRLGTRSKSSQKRSSPISACLWSTHSAVRTRIPAWQCASSSKSHGRHIL